MDASYMAGVTVGFLIAAPIGPTSIFCIERTLGSGIRAGLATGLGVASVHLAYATLIVLTGPTLVKLDLNEAFIGVISGAILMVFAARAMMRAVVFEQALSEMASLRSAYISAVVFASLNPLTPVLFAGFGPRLLQQGNGATLLIPIGAFAGSFLWWAILVMCVSWFRRQMNHRLLTVCNRLAGALLALMGVVAITGALSHNAIASRPQLVDGSATVSHPTYKH